MITSDVEKEALDSIVPELEKEGYELVTNFSPSLLPKEIKDYRPDAIAVKEESKIAIEIKARYHSSLEAQLEKIKSKFEQLPGWEMRIYFADQMKLPDGMQAEELFLVRNRLSSASALLAEDQSQAALLIGWASLEALARRISSDRFARPQTPGRIITVLSELGYIEREDADFLRQMAIKRNRFIHGGLSEELQSTDVKKFLSIVRDLVEQEGIE